MGQTKGLHLLIACFSFLLLCGQVLAGTVDNATLDPSFSFSTVGTSTITFSALNNKSFTLTSYEIWISYDWGIGVSITGTSPGAAIAEVDTSARSVHLFWQNIPPGTEMQATIKVNSTGNEGEYMLTPSSSTYYNRNKRYYGPCSTARVVFRKDMLPIESRAINNSIIVLWKPSSNPSTVGYRLYKRTSTTDYDIANSFYVTGLTYTDINVQNSVAYYYKVAALDQTGNELEVSPETVEMFLNTKIRTYGASVREKMAIGDIDGNGIPDLAVGSGRVDIYMNNNVSPVPDLTLYGENSVDEFGASLVLVDMNNDGHDDLVVGAPGYINTSTNRTSGKVYVYAGGSSLSQTPVNVFVGQSQAFTCDYSHYYLYVSEELGESISVAGDINADGFKDVAVGSPLGGLDRSGRVLFLLGGPGIVSGTAEITGENCGDHLGSSVAFAGDVNGDGYGDIISGTYYDVNEPGKAYLMYGAPIPYLSDLVFYENRAGYGNAVTGLDIDGDGFSDIGVGANSVIHDISVYRGNTSPDASPDLSFGRPRNLPDTLFVASIGDLNGDGYEDLITSGSASGAVVFMGHNPTDNVPDILLPGVDIKDVKDIDHDGLKEVVAVSAGGIGLHSLSPYADLPHIVVTSPQNYETMDTLSLSLSGFVDGYVTRLLVGGEEIQIGPDGSFEAQVPVVVGRNGIEIIAQGIDGRTAKRKLYGIYGMSPMAVQITSPIDGITVCESLLDVVGTVSQPAVQVKVDWEGAFNSSNMYVTAAGNDFLATIGLFSGLNTVTSTATDPYGIPASHTIQVMYDNQCNIPSITLGAQPQAIQAGQSANLTWTTTYANSVTIDNGIGFVPLDGSITVSPTQTTTYVLSATGPGGTSTTSATITVGPPVPTVVISAQPSSIIAGSSSTLTWSSTNATTAAIDNGIGTVAVAGSLDVSPPQTTTYTITVTGPDGTTTASTTVTVTAPQVPTATISAQPSSIIAGSSSTLTWSSTNATTAAIDNGIGTVAVAGSLSVAPAQTTTYTITVTGPGGTATASATVTVTPPPAPTVTISADLALIESGQSSTLAWSSTNATTAAIDNGIGTVAVNGSLTVSPSQTTTYTITVTGPGGTTTASFRICLKEETAYSYGDPTPTEQAFLEAVNRARLNPQAEATRLGIDLFEGVPQGAISDQPVQPLTFNSRLLQAAYLHSQDMIVHQYYSHTSQDGRTFYDRIAQAGYSAQVAAENLSSSFSSEPQEEVSTVLSLYDHLFVDAGVEGRVHRVNILTGTLKEMGIGFVPGSYESYPYAYLLTSDFGASSSDPNPFLLGVVYDDLNDDGMYTAGEGVGNVQIIIHEMGMSTATAPAGGYALRLPPGFYIVRAVLPDSREASRYVALSDQNVKVDFLITDFYYPAPSVTITSNPLTIPPGGSSTLTWSSTNTTSATIDNGVGAVAVSGSLVVSPSQTTTYAITVSGPGGIAMALTTVSVSTPSSISLAITSPSEGQPITGANVMVTGTVDNASGNETGVTVNGIHAIVSGGNFTASNVPLEEGFYTITAIARDTAGSTAETSVSVNTATTGDAVKIIALQDMGIAPFETTLRIEANFPIQGTPVLTFQGPGAVTFLESPGENEYAIRMTVVGVYTFTIEARDEANNAYTSSVVVQVIDNAILDQLLRTKWEEMKAALIAGNISGALQYFSEGSRGKYGAMFTTLSATLPAIIAAMQNISFAYMDGDRFAVYRITREEIIQGQPYQVTYHIYFVRDSDGIWRISWF